MNRLKSAGLTGSFCILLLGLGAAFLTDGFAQTKQDPALSTLQPLENLPLELEFHPTTGTLQIVYEIHDPKPLINLPEWVQMQLPFLGVLMDRSKGNRNRPILSLIDIRTGWVFAKKEIHWTRPDITFKWPFLKH
ncbi:MAG: hypothetical protein O2954_15720, partial [bacterium]|nr:hypothetical protein [bacterium]